MTTNESNTPSPDSGLVDSQLKATSSSSVDDVDVSIWFRSGQRRTGYIQGCTFDLKEVEYSEIDGDAILEGDILLGTLEEMEKFAEMVRSGEVPRGVGLTNKGQRWTRGIVPYVMDESIPAKEHKLIREAIQHWTDNTPIRFVERTPENENEFPNYVRIQNRRPGCFATLGMVGGEQKLNLSQGCYHHGTIVHEIGHTVGLYHEQSREDRNKFVQILPGNIEFKDENNDGQNDTFVVNFTQAINDGDDIGEYDFDSIMHYDSTAFGKLENNTRLTTIEPLDPEKEDKRQRLNRNKQELSRGDIVAVRLMYEGIVEPSPAPAPAPPPTPTPAPTPTPPLSTIVPVYQYSATIPVWRYLYSATQSEGFIRDGWILDGVVFRAFDQSQPGTVPVYRHVAEEPWRYQLSRQAAIGQGWKNEGVAFYVFAEPQAENSGLSEPLVPIYQYYAIDEQGRWRYQYSTQENIENGWKLEKSAFYALATTAG